MLNMGEDIVNREPRFGEIASRLLALVMKLACERTDSRV